jgi:hypothetical protein
MGLITLVLGSFVNNREELYRCEVVVWRPPQFNCDESLKED